MTLTPKDFLDTGSSSGYGGHKNRLRYSESRRPKSTHGYCSTSVRRQFRSISSWGKSRGQVRRVSIREGGEGRDASTSSFVGPKLTLEGV